jgi:hypothetical protein
MSSPIFAASAESQRLSAFLIRIAQAEDHRVILYDELSKEAQCNVLEKRNVLETARRTAIREVKAVFGVVRSEGIKLLTDAETVDDGVDGRKKIRRAAGRNLKKHVCVNREKLADDERTIHDINGSICNLVLAANSQPTIKKIEGGVITKNEELSVRGIVDLLKN